MTRELATEFLGALWLVLGGCGRAVLTVRSPGFRIGSVGIFVAFGLTV